MLEGDGGLELPTSALPEAEPPTLLLRPLSLAHIEQPHFSLAAPTQALVSVMVSFTAPEVLSSSNLKRDGAVKLQPCVLGSSLAAPWLLLRGLAKGAGWNGEAVQQPQTFSSHKLALGKLGKAGSLMGWECGGGFGAVRVELFS